LLELMAVVVIAGLLLAVGVPAMGDFFRNARITRAANDVMVGLHFARSEAIKRRQPVTLCTSADSLNANPVCTASAQLFGWIAFVDTNQNGQRDGVEPVLNPNAARMVLCDERGNVNAGGELSAARGITISVTGRAGVTRDPNQIQALMTAIGGTIAGCSA
jgi:type IV fimbrial biogenesis protein FimT